MSKLISSIWKFIISDFSLKQYSLILLLAFGLIGINYFIKPLESDLINNMPEGAARSLGYFVLYAFSYYAASAITLTTKNRLSVLKNRSFLVLSFLAIVVFSLDSGFWLPKLILSQVSYTASTYSFYHSLISNGKGLITISAVLLVINFITVRNNSERLGLNKEADLKPFFILLTILAPIIFFSALDSGLSNYYPTFKYSHIGELWKSPQWVPALIYELIYGADFFNIELFFRGFMVIGLSTIMGREAVVPMAVFYCTIHFGKPFVECISSLFGGYILGIIAFETRNIWGGIVLHIGVAWLMEIAGTLS